MPREAKAYLYDMRQAAALIADFITGLDYHAYAADAMVRAAVERQFEIIGEALGKLAKVDPETAGRISDYQRIIAFRNILIHGYAGVDDMLVWDMIGTRLGDLRREVDELLAAG
ncbi:MAG TPA: HepT-like ribonuclease domain-containing protein [Candidatus Limnocylindrales bacterium]|nr:HepT-like ribonuclease domain-containing protein [Candidatus Limnocylindrales bacterium]